MNNATTDKSLKLFLAQLRYYLLKVINAFSTYETVHFKLASSSTAKLHNEKSFYLFI